jgi:hypothetical protein
MSDDLWALLLGGRWAACGGGTDKTLDFLSEGSLRRACRQSLAELRYQTLHLLMDTLVLR